MSAIIFNQVVAAVEKTFAEKQYFEEKEVRRAVIEALKSTNFDTKFSELVEFSREILKKYGQLEDFNNDIFCLCDLNYHTDGSIWNFVSSEFVETQGFCCKPSEFRNGIVKTIVEKTIRDVMKK